MIGFELLINGVVKQAALNHGVTAITITKVKDLKRNETNIIFSGMDNGKHQNLTWLFSNLKENDTITITVKDINENSKPEKVEQLNVEDKILEGKLRAYNALKKELESQGHI